MSDTNEPMNAFVRAAYDEVADAYQDVRRGDVHDLAYLEQLVAQLPPNARVLDVGCGPGIPITAYLAAADLEVTGIDISPAQIALARHNVPAATFHLRDMSSMRESEFSVDAIVAFYSIFHTPKEGHGRLLATLRSFLPSGGRLLCTFGSTEWQGEEPFLGVPMRWSHYGAEKSQSLIAEAGFNIELAEIAEHHFDDELERHLVVSAVAA